MKVAFLDRDGTLIWEPPDTKQVDSIDRLRILPDVIKGLRLLRDGGYELVMVTNQDGLGTPSFPMSAFQEAQNEFLRLLHEQGIEFLEIFICPHFPQDRCFCRKPSADLVSDFLGARPIDIVASIMIGDRQTDEDFASNIGVRFLGMPTNGQFPDIEKYLYG